MAISIIIPTLNEEGYIEDLLESIHCQTQTPSEVIVIDGGSVDKTKEIVSNYPVVSLYETEKSVGNQRTYGGMKAKGDLFLFLDADTRLPTDFIEKSLQELDKKGLEIACPRYVPYPGSFFINVFYSFFNQLFRFAEKHMPSGAGSCIFVRKSVFRNVGGFDISLTFDDIHFIRLAAKKGLFGMLNTKIYVSDRRIRKYGFLNITITYIALSVCFLFGAYQLANRISYSFGIFQKYK